ncbi:SAM-dependent methyltransferase [Rossellomorea sp. SC111]|uniref:class I SAM-dependent methyltransferase n=1 Tax=Rossellomorea sp. SC111 TaxID=2968985 RepID=UPI00215AC600|nr:SAM-dependent methyltransferase [Rossellomorea sp. SC111]MCR8847927.1 SAM-dependent methyltransferase [Rossellomorea sp. SC111]
MNNPPTEIKVVIGAGEYHNNPGWLHTQEEDLNLLNENTWQDMFEESSISAILAEHVWEHLTYEEGLQAAKTCMKYLKPSGYIRCAVPDGYFPDEDYQSIVKIGGPGPEDHPAASHKIVYNYKLLTEVFESAGFEVGLLEYCDENGRFHQYGWDGADGVIFRSKKFDPRNQGERLVAPSLIIDAFKRGNR